MLFGLIKGIQKQDMPDNKRNTSLDQHQYILPFSKQSNRKLNFIQQAESQPIFVEQSQHENLVQNNIEDQQQCRNLPPGIAIHEANKQDKKQRSNSLKQNINRLRDNNYLQQLTQIKTSIIQNHKSPQDYEQSVNFQGLLRNWKQQQGSCFADESFHGDKYFNQQCFSPKAQGVYFFPNNDDSIKKDFVEENSSSLNQSQSKPHIQVQRQSMSKINQEQGDIGSASPTQILLLKGKNTINKLKLTNQQKRQNIKFSPQSAKNDQYYQQQAFLQLKQLKNEENIKPASFGQNEDDQTTPDGVIALMKLSKSLDDIKAPQFQLKKNKSELNKKKSQKFKDSPSPKIDTPSFASQSIRSKNPWQQACQVWQRDIDFQDSSSKAKNQSSKFIQKVHEIDLKQSMVEQILIPSKSLGPSPIKQMRKSRGQKTVFQQGKRVEVKLIPHNIIRFSFGDKTPQQFFNSNNSKYSLVLLDIFQRHPQNFHEYMNMYLNQILEEEQASQLFKVCLSGPTIQSTKDKIIKLFFLLQQKQLNKKLFFEALRDFKLDQIPDFILQTQFNKDFLQLIHYFAPESYIGDIINTDITFVDQILENYFTIQELPLQQYDLEGVQINLTSPRNILNIIMFMNQTFNLPLQKIFKHYCLKVLKYGHDDIFQKLVKTENIISVCRLKQELIEEILVEHLNSISVNYFKEQIKIDDKDQLWVQIKNYFRNMIEIGTPANFLYLSSFNLFKSAVYELLQYKIQFDIRKLHDLKPLLMQGQEKKEWKPIMNFLKNIVQLNPIESLANFDLVAIYSKIWQLQKFNFLQCYTIQLVRICQYFAQAFMSKKYYLEAFSIIKNTIQISGKAFICKLLVKYAQGKLANRLIAKDINKFSLQKIFPEIFVTDIDFNNKNPTESPKKSVRSLKKKQLRRDQLLMPQKSACFLCSWNNLSSIYEACFKTSLTNYYNLAEIKYIVFMDLKLAWSICQKGLLDAVCFKKFLTQSDQYCVVQIPAQTKNQQQNDYFDVTDILFDRQEIPKQIVTPLPKQQSMKIFNSFGFGQQNTQKPKQNQQNQPAKEQAKIMNPLEFLFPKMNRTHSSAQNPHSMNMDPDLAHLIIQVDQYAIINSLREIFLQGNSEKFLSSLILSKDKIRIFHIEKYKHLVGLNLSIDINDYLQLQAFFMKDRHLAFKYMEKIIQRQLDMSNFWMIYMIAQIMFERGYELGNIFVKKIIKYQRSDNYAPIVQYLLQDDRFLWNHKFLTQQKLEAQAFGMLKIASILERYLQNHETEIHQDL